MSLHKHEIPILEYDDNPVAVIQPDHEKLNISLPERGVFAFLSDHVDIWAKAHDFRQVSTFLSATKSYPIYVGNYGGCELCLCQAPVGAAPAAQILDWLISYGVKKIISAGSCGALAELPENNFYIPEKALRDEGTSYHYVPASRFLEINRAAIGAMEKALDTHGIPHEQVVTWTTDGFFRETREKVLYRKQEGCQVVEMECAALAAVAKLRGAVWGELLFTADTLADLSKYDERSWGEDSFAPALELAMEAVCRL